MTSSGQWIVDRSDRSSHCQCETSSSFSSPNAVVEVPEDMEVLHNESSPIAQPVVVLDHCLDWPQALAEQESSLHGWSYDSWGLFVSVA